MIISNDKGTYRSQLARVKTARDNVKRPKISEAIVRRKLALLAGNGVDCMNLNFKFAYLLATTFEKGFSRFQAVYRSYVTRKLYQKRGKSCFWGSKQFVVRDQAYRDNVAKEILSTEQTYVDNLSSCIKVFHVDSRFLPCSTFTTHLKKQLRTRNQSLTKHN